MTSRSGYLGPPGTFGEQAALTYLKQAGMDLPKTPLPGHDHVIAATDSDPDALGVVAIENSLGGAVNDVMDGILTAKALFVCAEIVVCRSSTT